MNYSGIDLHSNNSVVTVIDEADRVMAERRLPNDLTKILAFLAPWQAELAGVVVESTYNWYWLVDGLKAAGFIVHLAKNTGDQEVRWSQAQWRRDRCTLPSPAVAPRDTADRHDSPAGGALRARRCSPARRRTSCLYVFRRCNIYHLQQCANTLQQSGNLVQRRHRVPQRPAYIFPPLDTGSPLQRYRTPR